MGIIRRYQSEIYGNYRLAYVRYGAVVGAVMALVFLFFSVIGEPFKSPDSYISDILLLVGILFFTYRYRTSLPGGKVSFKELMLLGLGIGAVAAVVYGFYLWLHLGVLYPGQVQLMRDTETAAMTSAGSEALNMTEQQLADNLRMVTGYGAGVWAFRGAFRSFVFSIIMAFVAALVFKTEMVRKQ